MRYPPSTIRLRSEIPVLSKIRGIPAILAGGIGHYECATTLKFVLAYSPKRSVAQKSYITAAVCSSSNAPRNFSFCGSSGRPLIRAYQGLPRCWRRTPLNWEAQSRCLREFIRLQLWSVIRRFNFRLSVMSPLIWSTTVPFRAFMMTRCMRYALLTWRPLILTVVAGLRILDYSFATDIDISKLHLLGLLGRRIYHSVVVLCNPLMGVRGLAISQSPNLPFRTTWRDWPWPCKPVVTGHDLSPRDSQFVFLGVGHANGGFVMAGVLNQNKERLRRSSRLSAQGLRSGTSPPRCHQKQNPRDLLGGSCHADR